MFLLHDRAAVEVVVSALGSRSLRYVIGVTDASQLVTELEVIRAFAMARPQLFRRALRGKRRPSRDGGEATAPARLATLAVWSAPLSGLEVEGARASLVTVVEKARRTGIEPLCLHLVTGEPVATRAELSWVLDTFLGHP